MCVRSEEPTSRDDCSSGPSLPFIYSDLTPAAPWDELSPRPPPRYAMRCPFPSNMSPPRPDPVRHLKNKSRISDPGGLHTESPLMAPTAAAVPLGPQQLRSPGRRKRSEPEGPVERRFQPAEGRISTYKATLPFARSHWHRSATGEIKRAWNPNVGGANGTAGCSRRHRDWAGGTSRRALAAAKGGRTRVSFTYARYSAHCDTGRRFSPGLSTPMR